MIQNPVRFFIHTCVVFTFAGGIAMAEEGGQKARALILDPAGKEIGTAVLAEQKDGVVITLKVAGLTPGKHGFHIHETGTCDPPEFKLAGSHFNPYKKHHGAKSPQGSHAGDLPNLEVKEDGTAEITAVARQVTLGKGPASLLKEGGTALVIHGKPDDYVSDPAGNAGPRVACGEIRVE